MKPNCSSRRNHALTLVEVVVVVFVIGLLLAILLPALAAAKKKSSKLNCASHLKQVGLAFRIWSGDNGDKYPMEVSVTNGGAMETCGTNAWINYLVMSNELSTPKILICPQDTDRWPAATNFSAELKTKISYFVGLDAKLNSPQALLSGDDNFAIGGDSVKPGLVSINSSTPIEWTSTRHAAFKNSLLDAGKKSKCRQPWDWRRKRPAIELG